MTGTPQRVHDLVKGRKLVQDLTNLLEDDPVVCLRFIYQGYLTVLGVIRGVVVVPRRPNLPSATCFVLGWSGGRRRGRFELGWCRVRRQAKSVTVLDDVSPPLAPTDGAVLGLIG